MFLVPLLQTEDIARTRAWYETVLGFACIASDRAAWLRLARDGVGNMFMSNARMGARGATATRYIHVDDVMGLWASVANHVPAEWGPQRMSYGMIEFAIKDPNGYLLSFGQATA
jgi:catechol 2,3-dioxygenase-like lactoylglutathione lyase family enzyme